MPLQFAMSDRNSQSAPQLTIKDVTLIYGHPRFILEYWGMDEEGYPPVEDRNQGGVLFPDFSHEDPFNPPEDTFLSVCNARGEGNKLRGDLVFTCASQENARDLRILAENLEDQRPVYVSPRYVGKLTLTGKPIQRRFVCWDVIGKPIAQPSVEGDRHSFLVSLEDHTDLSELVKPEEITKIVDEYYVLAEELKTVLDDLLVKK